MKRRSRSGTACAARPRACLRICLLALAVSAALLVGCGSDEGLAEISYSVEGRGASARLWIPVNEARSIGTYRGVLRWDSGETTEITSEREGMVTGVWLEDLTGDENPELIVAMSSAGSGSYGGVDVYGKTSGGLDRLFLASLGADQREGYMGHDTFNVEDGTLVRSFPVYLADDPNAEPTGGTALWEYSFREGRWVQRR